MVEKKISISDRSYKILTYLEEYGNMKCEQLAEVLNCSGKTIQNEISDLSKILPDCWSIETVKGQGTRLIIPLDQTVATTFKNEVELLYLDLFQILIENDGITLENLCEIIHYNKNTVIGLLKKLEKMMAAFSLKLERAPYRVAGNEAIKRLFIFDIIYKFKGPSNFQVEVREENIDLLKKYLKENCGINISFYGINAFIQFLDISADRINKGYVVQNIDKYFKNNISQREEYKNIQGFLNIIGEIYSIELSQDERKIIYLALLFTDINFDLLKVTAKDELIFKDLTNLIHIIEENFEIQGLIEWTEELLSNMFTLYKIMLMRSDFVGIDYIPSSSILKSLKEQYKYFYQNIEQLILKFMKEKNIQVSQSFIIRSMVLFVENIEASPRIQVKALFIPSRAIVVNDFLFHSIKLQFPSKLELEVGTIENLNNDISEVDFIITDLVIEKEISPMTVLVHSVPTQSDFLKIKSVVEQKLYLKLYDIFNRKLSPSI